MAQAQYQLQLHKVMLETETGNFVQQSSYLEVRWQHHPKSSERICDFARFSS